MSSNIKQSAKRLGPVYHFARFIYVYLLKLRRQLREYKNRERRCSFGNANPDKTFYIIGVQHTTGGLFAIIKSVFCHICYAIEQGYIPVVDMEHFSCQLTDGTKETNAWEAYFEQPCGYTLKDIADSKNIILSASLPYPKGISIGFDTPMNKELYDRYHRLFAEYIRPCEPVRIYLETKYDMVTHGRTKILGVLCRGTDYTESRPVGHPIQPTASQAFEKAQEIMEKFGFENLFLATEDKRIYDYFKAHYGNQLLFSGQKLYASMGGVKFLADIPVADYSEKWHNIVDYYATIYILSKCDGLSTGLTCGSICAYLMSDEYEHVYFWDLGQYT